MFIKNTTKDLIQRDLQELEQKVNSAKSEELLATDAKMVVLQAETLLDQDK